MVLSTFVVETLFTENVQKITVNIGIGPSENLLGLSRVGESVEV